MYVCAFKQSTGIGYWKIVNKPTKFGLDFYYTKKTEQCLEEHFLKADSSIVS